MLRFSRRAVLLGGCASLVACRGDGGDSSPPPPPPPPPPPAPPPPPPPAPPPTIPPIQTLPFSFGTGLDGWEPAYSDYSPGMEESIGFTFGHEVLPADLEGTSALFLAGHNFSDDVFMYITRLVTGLAPNTNYRVGIEVAIATNIPADCVGMSGDALIVKAGATNVKPASVVDSSQGIITVNFDKGNQLTSGANAVVIGNWEQETSGDCSNAPYKRKTLSNGAAGLVVSSDSQGQLWLVIGTESAFEAYSKVHYLEGVAVLAPA